MSLGFEWGIITLYCQLMKSALLKIELCIDRQVSRIGFF